MVNRPRHGLWIPSSKTNQMEPLVTGQKYDKIAHWWNEQHVNSNYGVSQFKRALSFTTNPGDALDVGCGSGGRFVSLLQNHGFSVTGIDVSHAMIGLARENHPDQTFEVQDICTWETECKFDFIVSLDLHNSNTLCACIM